MLGEVFRLRRIEIYQLLKHLPVGEGGSVPCKAGRSLNTSPSINVKQKTVNNP
jgi:hypothetical protein